MFIDDIKHTLISTICAIENFTFTIKNKFLQVKSHRFSNAEIFSILGNTDLHFFTGAEEMINSITTCKDDS